MKEEIYVSTLLQRCRLECNCSPFDYHYRVSKAEQTDLPQGQTPTESLTPAYVIQSQGE